MSDIQKIEHLTKRCSDLLAEMKLHQRENVANKKRADTLQREKDLAVSNLSKNTTLKEKLEKLCRELQKENNKLKVCGSAMSAPPPPLLLGVTNATTVQSRTHFVTRN